MKTPDFAKLLHLNGELLEGVSSADSSTLKSRSSCCSKAICAVSSWIVLDVVAAENRSEAKHAFNLEGYHRAQDALVDSKPVRLPLVLFAHFVERHSSGRFERGVSIRSDFAIAYDGRGIFETEDTLYLLFGKGLRRPISFDAITCLPEGLVKEDYSIDRQTPRRGIAALNRSPGLVYCDVQMSIAQGEALLALAQTLRASGQHSILDSVFRDIEHEISISIRQA